MTSSTLLSRAALFFVVVAALLSSGCVSVNRMTEGAQSAYDGKVVFTAPVGWVRYDAPGQPVTITRDGATIQTANIRYGKSETVFPKTKPVLGSGRLPQEIGEMAVAERRSQLGNTPLKVKEIVPAMVGGVQGFRAQGTYRNERGAPYETVIAGALVGDSLVIVSYQALAVNFFSRDLASFDTLLNSLVLK